MDNFVKTLIEEVKSQGVFDEFRFNCCLADVDTKPAYQNVRNRVETAVNDFLAKQHWTPDTNKVQLRERLRKHLLDSDVLDKGVDHIVDQVVNPKVATIFEPKIESIAYKYLGIPPPPPPANPPPRPPLLPAPPLPPYPGHTMSHMNGGNLLRVETTASMLPTDLEQISPDSDRATVKSDLKEDSKDDELPPGVDIDDLFDDDEATSPAFEPAASIKEDTNHASLNTSDSVKDVKELGNDSRDAGASQASQLSQVSSDSRLTIASMDAPQTTSTNNNSVELTTNMAANISEEAQMPKFNENSSDANDNSGRQLHFDIKQDAITFEGTERRNSLSESNNGGMNALSIEDAIMCEVNANISNVNISTNEPTTEPSLEPTTEPTPEPTPEATPEPTPEITLPEPLITKSERSSDSNIALFADSNSLNPKDDLTLAPQELPKIPEIKSESPPAEAEKPEEEKPNEDKPEEEKPIIADAAATTLPIATDELKEDIIKVIELAASPASATSSSQTKKHSHSHSKDKDKRHHSHSHSDDKQRHKSREREHEKSRGKTSSSSKHSSRTSHSSSSKHRTSSSSKNDKNSTSTPSSRSTHESSTSSKRSSSRHDSSSHKKHKSSSSSSRSERDRERSRDSHSHHSRSHNGSGSSSSASKRGDRDRERDRNKSSSNSATPSITAVIQDDHNEEKAKLQKRHSNDSNDEGKPPGFSSKSPTESTEAAKSKEKTTAENGKASETKGRNGTNDNNDQCQNQTTTELVSISNVVIVSDILQQSTLSFVEISGAGSVQKATEIKISAVEKESESSPVENLKETTELESKPKSPAQVAEPESTAASEPPAVQAEQANDSVVDPAVESVVEPLVESAVDPIVEPALKPIMESAVKLADSQEITAEIEVKDDSAVSNSSEDIQMKSDKAADIEEPVSAEPGQESAILAETSTPPGEKVTHFEQDAEQFKERLQMIEQHIKDRRRLLNVFSESDKASFALRCASKRRLSSEASTSKQHNSSSGSSSSCAGSPAKRTRRSDAKTSPTPSEISVNSKENEELGKHEKVNVTTRRLSQKLCQQQRYNNDDLYKPRPLLSQRSRRRGLDSIH